MTERIQSQDEIASLTITVFNQILFQWYMSIITANFDYVREKEGNNKNLPMNSWSLIIFLLLSYNFLKVKR